MRTIACALSLYRLDLTWRSRLASALLCSVVYFVCGPPCQSRARVGHTGEWDGGRRLHSPLLFPFVYLDSIRRRPRPRPAPETPSRVRLQQRECARALLSSVCAEALSAEDKEDTRQSTHSVLQYFWRSRASSARVLCASARLSRT